LSRGGAAGAGRTLQDALRSGPLSAATALHYAAQIASALGARHRAGGVHGEVSAPNVIVEAPGRVRLAEPRPAGLDDEGEPRFVGNPRYLSPEQLMGKPAVPASDVFALGVLLHEMLTGRYVFEGDTFHQTLFRLLHGERDLDGVRDPRARDILGRALDPDPGRRFPDGDSLAAALGTLLWEIEG
jgi:serine/threonine-protein kinase